MRLYSLGFRFTELVHQVCRLYIRFQLHMEKGSLSVDAFEVCPRRKVKAVGGKVSCSNMGMAACKA